MGFYTRKIIFGLVLSLAGILASFAWYKFDLNKFKTSEAVGSKIVAHLSFTRNEVQKKQAKRVIWQKVGEEEDLRTGEAIRTATDSEAKITFLSGAQIEMDPDSVVVIEDGGDKINLDFVKGNLLFKGGDPKNGDLGLKSGNTSIALGNADMTFNKSNGSNIDVQVLRGTAEVDQNGKKLILDKDKNGFIDENGVSVSDKFFKVKSPTAFSKTYIRTDKKDPVVFEWEPLSANYDVYLEIGKTREKMERMMPKVSGASGSISSQVKLGTYFWRLVAIDSKDPKKTYSFVPTKLTVTAEQPPVLISPAKDATTTLSAETRKLPLRWTNPSRLEKMHVEISKDPRFSKNSYSENVDNTGVHQAELEEDGNYYWRVIGFRPGTTKEVSSDIQRFTFTTKIRLIPPDLKGPQDNSKVTGQNVASGNVFLAWTPVLGMDHYVVKIFDADGKVISESKVTDGNQIKFAGYKPGLYKWSVTSVDGEGKLSASSPLKSLTVEDLPELKWADGKQQENYFYLTEKPQFRVSVKPLAGAKSFRLVYKKNEPEAPEKKVDLNGGDRMVDVEKPGVYGAVMEALNDKGFVMARTKPKDFVVQPKPLLAPPDFAEKTAESLTAQKNGSTTFALKSVNGARSYVINIKTSAGKMERSEKSPSTSVTIKNLLPGTYKINLASVDEHGRVGPVGKEKSLVVPSVSDSKAPGLRKLQVK